MCLVLREHVCRQNLDVVVVVGRSVVVVVVQSCRLINELNRKQRLNTLQLYERTADDKMKELHVFYVSVRLCMCVCVWKIHAFRFCSSGLVWTHARPTRMFLSCFFAS